MAQALLVIDDPVTGRPVIALGPDGQPLVGDPATGAGWDCCCGGGSSCCFDGLWEMCNHRGVFTAGDLGSRFLATITVDATSSWIKGYNYGQQRTAEYFRRVGSITIRLSKDAQCRTVVQCVGGTIQTDRSQTDQNGAVTEFHETLNCSSNQVARIVAMFDPRGGGSASTTIPPATAMFLDAVGFGYVYDIQSHIGGLGNPDIDLLTPDPTADNFRNGCSPIMRWAVPSIFTLPPARATFAISNTIPASTIEHHVQPVDWRLQVNNEQRVLLQGFSNLTATFSAQIEQVCGTANFAGRGVGADGQPIDPGVAENLRKQRGCEGCGG